MTAHSKSLYITKTGMTIDPGHAFFNIVGVDKVFNTINVKAYQPLQNAVKLGVVERHTKLMVFEIAGQTLSIPLQDMAYHHVAQGEQNGQAWVAFFLHRMQYGFSSQSRYRRRNPSFQRDWYLQRHGGHARCRNGFFLGTCHWRMYSGILARYSS